MTFSIGQLASVKVWQNYRGQHTIAEFFQPKSRPRRHDSDEQGPSESSTRL